jgi:hypothetical protein
MISAKVENQCIAIDSEGVKLYKAWGWSGVGGDYEVYNPPKMLFPSLEIGENKTYPITIVPYQIDDVAREINKKSGTLTITLDSTENVEVPAGKFKNCLKFISVFEFKKVNKFGDEQTPSKQTVITWLAPGVGKVKSELTLSEYIGLPDRKIDELTELMELKEATVNGNKLP